MKSPFILLENLKKITRNLRISDNLPEFISVYYSHVKPKTLPLQPVG